MQKTGPINWQTAKSIGRVGIIYLADKSHQWNWLGVPPSALFAGTQRFGKNYTYDKQQIVEELEELDGSYSAYIWRPPGSNMR
jgi:hypothetical protein